VDDVVGSAGAVGGWIGRTVGRPEGRSKDREALQGSWRLISRELPGGRSESGDGDEARRIVFKGDKFQLLKGEDVRFEGTFKIDPTTSPRTIDIAITKTNEEGSEAGKTSLGIYELKGDEMRWCAAEPGHADRPKEFSPEGGPFMLVSMKREVKQAK
jgi:uncharacterized protein (TIGR03067 family)